MKLIILLLFAVVFKIFLQIKDLALKKSSLLICLQIFRSVEYYSFNSHDVFFS